MDTKIIEMMPRRTDKSADDPTYKSEVGFEHVEGDDDVTANENVWHDWSSQTVLPFTSPL